MRLIDADALIEKLKYHRGKIGERTNIISSTTCDAIDTTIYVIKTQPTINSDIAARCRDCIYSEAMGKAKIYRWCKHYGRTKNADGFCDQGERREEQDEGKGDL